MADEKVNEVKPNKQAAWQGRPISEEGHVNDLEREAAIHEFGNHLPRAEAEEKAYTEYKKEQHARAAAHHLSGMRAAHASGNNDEARKHGIMYDSHVKALGHDSSIGPVPHDVARYAKEDDKGPYQFKNHGADSFMIDKSEDAIMKKAEHETTEGLVTNNIGEPASVGSGPSVHAEVATTTAQGELLLKAAKLLILAELAKVEKSKGAPGVCNAGLCTKKGTHEVGGKSYCFPHGKAAERGAKRNADEADPMSQH